MTSIAFVKPIGMEKHVIIQVSKFNLRLYTYHIRFNATPHVQCATLEENKYHCDSKPCVNGKCIGVINDFFCICQPNWKGKACNNISKHQNIFGSLILY